MTTIDQKDHRHMHSPEPIATATRPAVTDPLWPHEDEAWLAALLLTNVHTGLREEALREVAPGDFRNAHIAGLWAAARALVDRGDRITARSLLAAKDGGTASAQRVLDEVATVLIRAADYRRVVAEVQRCARLRDIQQAAREINERVLHAEDAEQALSWALTRLGDIDQAHTAPEVYGWAALLDRWQHAVTEGDADDWLIPTPWADVDDVMGGGLRGGRMVVVGARPGEGKSIVAHRMAVHAAAQGHPALVFSMEMGHLEVTGRMVAGAAHIEMGEIARRDLSQHSYQRLTEWLPAARGWPLWLNDRPNLTVDYIKGVCRGQKRRGGLRVVAVDYLQLVNATDRRQSREQQVAEISRQLKQMSRELDVCVVVPAQLNRAPTARGGLPMLSDLRESGGIEADADVVMLLARGVITEKQAKDDQALAGMVGEFDGSLNVVFAKNRLGPVCNRSLTWRGGYASITD